MKELSIAEKVTLTIKEAAAYSNIGQNKIRDMANEPNCDFVLMSGRNVLIKRKKFEEYLLSRSIV